MGLEGRGEEAACGEAAGRHWVPVGFACVTQVTTVHARNSGYTNIWQGYNPFRWFRTGDRDYPYLL